MSARKSFSFVLVLLALLLPAGLCAQEAPGAPGTMPTWTPGSKEAVGTATTANSHVWFTLQGGIVSEVYYPRLDTVDVRTLESAVSDGKHVGSSASQRLFMEGGVVRLRNREARPYACHTP